MISKEQLKRIFEQGLAARHAGRLDEARDFQERALLAIGAEQRRYQAIVHGELGYIYWELGDLAKATEHYRHSTAASPKSELASLGLFHVLIGQEYWKEGLEEILRFVRLRDSPEYRELLSDEFCQGLPPGLQPLAYTARELLDSHEPASAASDHSPRKSPEAEPDETG